MNGLTQRKVRWFVVQLTLALYTLTGCGGEESEEAQPSPGSVDPVTIEQVFVGEVFTRLEEDGDLFLLLAYAPGWGEVCMAYGPVEQTIDPRTGETGYDFDGLPVYTAEVNYSDANGQSIYHGRMFLYSREEEMVDGRPAPA